MRCVRPRHGQGQKRQHKSSDLNRHLAKAVQGQNFYSFRVELADKCRRNGIELRIADRWYPSSRLCSECGSIRKDLKLSDRTYRCDACGLVMDRDRSASINLQI